MLLARTPLPCQREYYMNGSIKFGFTDFYCKNNKHLRVFKTRRFQIHIINHLNNSQNSNLRQVSVPRTDLCKSFQNRRHLVLKARLLSLFNISENLQFPFLFVKSVSVLQGVTMILKYSTPALQRHSVFALLLSLMKTKNTVETFSFATAKHCGNNIPKSESPISKTNAISTFQLLN